MHNFSVKLGLIIGAVFLGIGVVTAAPSLDCGDDDAQPIEIHSAINGIKKDS